MAKVAFELSQVETRTIRQLMLTHLEQINAVLAAQVALALGEAPTSAPAGDAVALPGGTADSAAETAVLAAAVSPTTASGGLQRTAGLSMVEQPTNLVQGRKVALLAADGVDGAQLLALTAALTAAGVVAQVVGLHLGTLLGDAGPGVPVAKTLANTSSVLFDAVIIADGAPSSAFLTTQGDARHSIEEAYKHGKPIAVIGAGQALWRASAIGQLLTGDGDAAQATVPEGVVMGATADEVASAFLEALAHGRAWGRPYQETLAA